MGRLLGLKTASLLRQVVGKLEHRVVRRVANGSTSTLTSSNYYPCNTLSSHCYQITSSFYIPTAACIFSSISMGSRSYSSDSELPSNMVMVKSENELKESLRKAADKSSSSIFYFTAVWCGPCRFLWPHIQNLSGNLPDVKFYKVDIDEVQNGLTSCNLDISSVPTLYFFKNGKKVDQVVGADPQRIKDLTSSLYK